MRWCRPSCFPVGARVSHPHWQTSLTLVVTDAGRFRYEKVQSIYHELQRTSLLAQRLLLHFDPIPSCIKAFQTFHQLPPSIAQPSWPAL